MTIRGTNGYFGLSAYRGYLRDLPPNEIVGYANSRLTCPIARELVRLIGPAATFISARRQKLMYNTGPHGHIHPTPAWARAFMDEIDDTFPTGAGITAAEALAIIAKGANQ